MHIENKNILQQIKESNPHEPFKVPDGYFDSMVSRVQDKIAANTAPTPHTQTAWTKLKPAFSMAALVTGIALISYLTIKTISPFLNPTNTNQNAELASYLESNADDIDESMLMGEVSDSQNNTSNNNTTNDTISFLINANISDNEIIDDSF